MYFASWPLWNVIKVPQDKDSLYFMQDELQWEQKRRGVRGHPIAAPFGMVVTPS